MSLISPYTDIAMFSIPKGNGKPAKPAKHVTRNASYLTWHKTGKDTWNASASPKLCATVYRLSGAWQVTLQFNGKAKGFPLRVTGYRVARYTSFDDACRAAYDAMNNPALIEA